MNPSMISRGLLVTGAATESSDGANVADVSDEAAAVSQRFWAFSAAIVSGSVTLFAFLIPSFQAQWDRYEAREVVEEYVTLGDECMAEERYDVAEKAYEKAFELSLQTRLDIEMKRLKARVSRMELLTEWAAAPPEDLEDVDFQIILHLEKGKYLLPQRAATLHSYASFLAGSDRIPEAESALAEAIKIEPDNVTFRLNQGNLENQAGRKDQAIKCYQKVLELDPGNVNAHYNLGLVYSELNQYQKAQSNCRQIFKRPAQRGDQGLLAMQCRCSCRDVVKSIFSHGARFLRPGARRTPVRSWRTVEAHGQ